MTTNKQESHLSALLGFSLAWAVALLTVAILVIA